jgi:hypothetical protein
MQRRSRPTSGGIPGSQQGQLVDLVSHGGEIYQQLRHFGAFGKLVDGAGMDSSEKLGRHRWVVERTLAWLSRYRRLSVRYERRADIHEAFLHLGCSLICLNHLP